ncbi:MAG: transglutaminase domain-containing protein [Dehalococcoidales bacterium]|nr:transglutaminase domain-containing protein [Dehalococcoidales bacterium]
MIQYLQPTGLCDFDKTPGIKEAALEVTAGAYRPGEKVDRIFAFVKDITYRFDDWDEKASNTLEKGWGMCSGKSNLFVAMVRSIGIPARYVILRCRSEIELFHWITSRSFLLAEMMGEPYQTGDHVYAEVYLDRWVEYNPGRDMELEKGFRVSGIPVEMRPAYQDEDVRTRLSEFDEWAVNRQNSVRLPDDRKVLLTMLNEQLDYLRQIGGYSQR